MADYFQIVSAAVARLVKNDSENRAALYGRARVALVEQLREMAPPLSDTRLIHEQMELEKAIRKIESQHSAASKVKAGTVTPIAPMPKLFPKATD